MTEDLRKLDALVAERVMGLEITRDEGGWYGQDNYTHRVESGSSYVTTSIPRYSSDIGAAWTVVEKMLDRFQVGITFYDGRYECEINDLRDDKYYPEIYGHSKSAPHAICLAALRALKAVEAVG